MAWGATAAVRRLGVVVDFVGRCSTEFGSLILSAQPQLLVEAHQFGTYIGRHE